MKVKINALFLVCVLICNIFYVQVFADSEIQSYSENILKTGVAHLFTFDESFVPTGVTVNGQSTEKYQYVKGMILVSGDVFESAGEYIVAVTDGTNTLSTTVTISSTAEILYMPFENNDGNQSSNLCFNEYVDKDDDYSDSGRTELYTTWKRSGSVFNIGDVKYCSTFIQQYYGRAYFIYNINQTGKYDIYYSTGSFSSNVNCSDVGIDIKTAGELKSVILTKAEQEKFKLIASDVEFTGKSDKSEYIKFYRPATITKGALGVGVVKLVEKVTDTSVNDAFYSKIMSTFNITPSEKNINELNQELSFDIGLTDDNRNYFNKDNAVIYADNVKVDNAVINADGTFTIPADTFDAAGKHEIGFKVNDNISISVKCEIIIIKPDKSKIYVSPDGSDNNNGSINSPFQTFAKAHEYAKQLIKSGTDEDITVYFREGEYTVLESVEITNYSFTNKVIFTKVNM